MRVVFRAKYRIGPFTCIMYDNIIVILSRAADRSAHTSRAVHGSFAGENETHIASGKMRTDDKKIKKTQQTNKHE